MHRRSLSTLLPSEQRCVNDTDRCVHVLVPFGDFDSAPTSSTSSATRSACSFIDPTSISKHDLILQPHQQTTIRSRYVSDLLSRCSRRCAGCTTSLCRNVLIGLRCKSPHQAHRFAALPRGRGCTDSLNSLRRSFGMP
jgi:hypothetical protein